MSKQANPALIGSFVVGAMILAIAGVLVFGSGQFFTDQLRYIMYFNDDMKGLNVGAPVTFRGVKVGSVSDIQLEFDATDESVRIAVYMELGEDQVKHLGVDATGLAMPMMTSLKRRGEAIERLIDRGLRAQLQLQSFVTGQLQVKLDFHPETPVRRLGIHPELDEFPTVPSTLSVISDSLEQIPIQELVAYAQPIVEGINRLVNAPEILQSLRSLDTTLQEIRVFVRHVNAQVDPMVSTLTETADVAREALQQIRKTLAFEDDNAARLASTIVNTSEATQATMTQIQKTLIALEGTIGPDSDLRFTLAQTLEELTSTARALRVFAEYLERHPESIIRGKR